MALLRPALRSPSVALAAALLLGGCAGDGDASPEPTAVPGEDVDGDVEAPADPASPPPAAGDDGGDATPPPDEGADGADFPDAEGGAGDVFPTEQEVPDLDDDAG